MFFLFFIAIPIIEVILFITVGKYIGLWNTIFIIIITGIIGAMLVKSQGISIFNKAMAEIKINKGIELMLRRTKEDTNEKPTKGFNITKTFSFFKRKVHFNFELRWEKQ